MTAPKPKLRWFQFSLRTLLVFVTLCAIASSWLAVKLQEAKRERETETAIEKSDGTVQWSEPPGPQWLRTFLGDDFRRHVVKVVAVSTKFTDASLENLEGLSQLQTLGLHFTNVTDMGLEHLKRLSQLQDLWLGGELKNLTLYKTNVTVEGVKKLQQELPNCKIGIVPKSGDIEGMKKFQQELPNCKIGIIPKSWIVGVG
jgi:hypothetical protein